VAAAETVQGIRCPVSQSTPPASATQPGPRADLASLSCPNRSYPVVPHAHNRWCLRPAASPPDTRHSHKFNQS
jgi:hypothetical protein